MHHFQFDLDLIYLPKYSTYNHNYFKILFDKAGDYLIPRKCNILYQRCTDDSDTAYYTLGYFDEKDNFISCFTWEDSCELY